MSVIFADDLGAVRINEVSARRELTVKDFGKIGLHFRLNTRIVDLDFSY